MKGNRKMFNIILCINLILIISTLYYFHGMLEKLEKMLEEIEKSYSQEEKEK